MRDDFAAFILTHGRPDRVMTYDLLRRAGYTGRIYLVIDDEDPTSAGYHERYPSEVLTFSKAQIAARFDQADNFTDRRTIFYARNACWALAQQVGVRFHIQLDDDYSAIQYRTWGTKPGALQRGFHGWNIHSLDRLLTAMVDFLAATPTSSIAFSQGGDHLGGIAGGQAGRQQLKRKAMNSFILDGERPFPFLGRINEDVSTYTTLGHRGLLFFTYLAMQITQKNTQQQAGGMTEVYVDTGTYVKSFYTVMHAPSCTRIGRMGSVNRRLHHQVAWKNAVPKILAEQHRKTAA